MATSTPWGKADHKEPVTRGINFYGTPSHGGYCVSRGMGRKMPPALRALGEVYGNAYWFEEDCKYAAVYLAFPEYFESAKVEAAHETLKSWYPDAYDATFGAREKGTVVLHKGEPKAIVIRFASKEDARTAAASVKGYLVGGKDDKFYVGTKEALWGAKVHWVEETIRMV